MEKNKNKNNFFFFFFFSKKKKQLASTNFNFFYFSFYKENTRLTYRCMRLSLSLPSSINALKTFIFYQIRLSPSYLEPFFPALEPHNSTSFLPSLKLHENERSCLG